jgi:hypothetical protein
VQQLHRLKNRQADDSGVAAPDLLDEYATFALNGIRASFVAGLSTLPVRAGFVRIDFSKPDVGSGHHGPHFAAIPDSDPGQDGVGLRRKASQHVHCISRIDRFPENIVAEYHGGISTKHDLAGIRGSGQRFLTRQTQYHRCWRFIFELLLVDVSASYAEFQPERRQDFPASRRRRGKV